MHELSIAMSIVELAQEEAERRGAQVGRSSLEAGSLVWRGERGASFFL